MSIPQNPDTSRRNRASRATRNDAKENNRNAVKTGESYRVAVRGKNGKIDVQLFDKWETALLVIGTLIMHPDTASVHVIK